MGIFRRQPPPAEFFDTVAEAARKKREASQTSAITPATLGSAVGIPNAAAAYILRLVARIEQLEQRVVALEGPPHVAKVEKR